MSTSNYTVRKLGWYQPPHGDPYTRRLPTATPVTAFNTFDEAEMHRRELESEARAGENPFRFGGGSVFFQSSLDGPRLHDWLMDVGIDPPVSELRHSDWRVWWNSFAHTWSEHQLAHAWAAFDKVRFYDVAQAGPSTAHVVIEIMWGHLERSWGTRCAGTEGGRRYRVFRRAAPADAECARGNRARARRLRLLLLRPPIGLRRRRDPHLAGAHRDLLRGRRGAVECPAVRRGRLPGAAPGHRGLGRGQRLARPTFPDARVPVALFAERGSADALRDQMNAESRGALNPFVFVEPNDGAATDFGLSELAHLRLPLPIPSSERRAEWVEWWDLCQDEVTDEQRAAVWNLCDRPLFEVIRVEVSDE